VKPIQKGRKPPLFVPPRQEGTEKGVSVQAICYNKDVIYMVQAMMQRMKMKQRVVFSLLPLFSSVYLALFFLAACAKRPAEHQVVTPKNGAVRIAVSEVHDGKVHFFTYKKSGKRINFFIRTDGKDNLSACFDACFTCYKHKKGYRQEGTDLICNECNLKFRLAEEQWDTSHGCSPIQLRSRIENGEVVITNDDLEKGARLF
jgi:uncharacterized membrane protein